MKIKQFEGYVLFKEQFIKIEEFNGINSNLILFNPDYSESFPDYKIQLTKKVFLKELKSGEFICFNDISEPFEIINSAGKIIANSDDLKPEFVDVVLKNIEKQVTLEIASEELN